MPGEDSPLLTAYPSPNQRLRRSTTLLVVVILLAACTYIGIRGEVKWWIPKDPQERADYYLSESPVIDGHIDLPELIREEYGNDLDRVDLEKKTPGDVDIPRIRKGHLGGFFFSAFVDCPPTTPSNSSDSDDFHAPTNAVRDTLEQIDLARLIITERYPDVFAFTKTAVQVEEALAEGKVAGLIGIEGAHQLGNSLAVLRTYYQLGVRYMTLTHGCNNVFADSGGIFSPVPPAHGGLSKIGRDLIGEMNRIGMMIDLSHVSDQTAEQALDLTEAPVMWSHSASRTFNNISRNVPDYLLERIGTGNRAKENGKKDAVVMVNFYPEFLLPRGKDAHGRVANVKTVADHVEHIARIAGKSHVGIGSDYDGVETVPKNLEDVSKYPALFTELIRRGGWSQDELAGLAGGNLLRVMKGVEETSKRLKDQDGRKASMSIWKGRDDLLAGRRKRGDKVDL